MKSATLIIVASLLLGFGDEPSLGQGPDPNAPVGSTPRILSDIQNERKEAEKKLSMALKKAIEEIRKSETISKGRAEMVIKNLTASQAAWEEFRRKQCSFLTGYYYEEIGSLGARAAGIWEYEKGLIEQRIKELEEPPNFF